MPRVSSATLKRLDRLDAPLRAERVRAAYVIALSGGAVSDETRKQFTLAQRTVLSWPGILSCDEWDALASVQQDALIAGSAEDRARPEAVVTPAHDDAAAQREHERLYQEARKRAAEGGLEYVRAKERQLRGIVR